jgi:predicted MFS family arabinose efflux permease
MQRISDLGCLRAPVVVLRISFEVRAVCQAYYRGKMFGTQYMEMLYGIVFLGHQVGSFIGVFLGGWLFDRGGSYDLVWWLGIALGIFAAIAHWPIREKPIERVAAEAI